MSPRPPSSALTVVRRPMGPPLATRAGAGQSQGPTAHPLRLRHNHIVPAAVLQTLDRLQPGAGRSIVALRQQEEHLLPSVDYSLTNKKLLPQLCHLLLQKCVTLAAQGRRQPLPPLCHSDAGAVCKWLSAQGPSKCKHQNKYYRLSRTVVPTVRLRAQVHGYDNLVGASQKSLMGGGSPNEQRPKKPCPHVHLSNV